MSEKLVAISASAASAQYIADYLAERERGDGVHYETGRLERFS